MGDLQVHSIGDTIVTRILGVPTVDLIRRCQEQVVQLARSTARHKVLHDCLDMEAPVVQVPMSQWELDRLDESQLRLKRAILVPDAKLGYLARIAFAYQNEARVFYGDRLRALHWLSEEP